MRWLGRKRWWRLQLRRLCAGAALVAYLAAAVGVPVAPTPAKDRSQPFPCQDHICGCRSADACWHHCCCFSPEEKRAWALAHHVEPPLARERPNARGWHTVRLRDQENKPSGCCTPHAGGASCCSSQASSPAKPAPPTGNSRGVPGMRALHCQGLTTLWVNGGTVLPPPPPTAWNPFLSPAGWLAFAGQSPRSLSLTPLDPPPRSLSA